MRGVEGKERRQREFKPASALYDQKGMKDLDETMMRGTSTVVVSWR